MDYINRIKKIKNEKNMTNDQLSELTGIPVGTLSKILAGINESPKLSNFVAICEALNCSLDYVMYGIDENRNNYTLDEQEIALIESYRLLDERGRDTVRAVVDAEAEYGELPARAPRQARVLAPVPLKERLMEAYGTSDNGFGKRELDLYELPVSAGTGVLLTSEERKDRISVSDTARTREADFALRISGNSMEPRYHNGDILLVQEAETLEFGELGIFMLDGSGFFKVYGGDRLYSLNKDYGDILLKDFEEAHIVGRVIGRLKKR